MIVQMFTCNMSEYKKSQGLLNNTHFISRLALAFVSAVYSTILGCILVLILLQQIILITLGISTQEWRNYSFIHKVCCLCANRPYSRGLVENWLKIFCLTRRDY